MLKTQFLIALRQLIKNRTTAIINILGLSLGLAAFMLILQYVAFEWSYNTMYSKSGKVFRTLLQEQDVTYAPPGYGPILQENFPQVRSYVRILPGTSNGIIRIEGEEGQSYRENESAFVDEKFLSYFGRPVLAGESKLGDPQTIMLSKSKAEQYFGEFGDAVGKQLRLDNQFGSTLYEVTGVYEDFPGNSDFVFEFVASLQTLSIEANRNGNYWADPAGVESSFCFLFVELLDEKQALTLSKEVNLFVEKNFPEAGLDIHFQPLAEIHLGKSLDDPHPTYGSRLFVFFLFIIAIVILSIAWINYINLSTAQSMERAREVSIRKVVGASRRQLIRQYLVETLLLTFVSAVIAIGLVATVQPYFNKLVELPLGLNVLGKSMYLWYSLLTIIAGALLSGFYVAYALTKFKLVDILKGRNNSKKGLWLRRGLVVGQFVVSIAFIACTAILFTQLQYLYNQDKGLNTEQRLVVLGPKIKGEGFELRKQSFRNQLGQLSFVEKFSAPGIMPGEGYNFSTGGITKENPRPGDEDISYRVLFVDELYADVFDIEMLSGRNFKEEEAISGWGSDKIIINEEAVKSLGFSAPEDAIGKKLIWDALSSPAEVVGVMKNYNHQSLRVSVDPSVFLPSRNSGYYIMAVRSNDWQSVLSQLEASYQEFFPGNPFEYSFMDENFAQMYAEEQRLSRLFSIGAILAIFISVLGLFGLITFIAKQKTKEIGIRKVLGASISAIIGLLSRDFIRLVLIALLIAIPLSWYLMNEWLTNFAYRIEIQWWVFAFAGLLTILIAFATMSYQSVRAAMADPIQALRDE